MRYPTVSIVTCSLNPNHDILRQTLDAIRNQRYPAEKIQHIVMDGGSTNGALEIFKKYHVQLIVQKDTNHRTQERMSDGILRATGELVLILETDNILPNHDWLLQMTRPFVDDPKLTGAISKYNTSTPDMPVFTRYCALFGINDPLVYYLKKSDKLPRFERRYPFGKDIKKNSEYEIKQFSSDVLPVMGDNGHMVRKSHIRRVCKKGIPYFHTDAFARLVSLGYDRFAIVENAVIHYTGNSLLQFLGRRVAYKRKFYDVLKNDRFYLVYDPHSPADKKNLMRFVLYSLTLVQPLSLSVRGYITKPDVAWFLHPIACLATLAGYGYSEVLGFFNALY